MLINFLGSKQSQWCKVWCNLLSCVCYYTLDGHATCSYSIITSTQVCIPIHHIDQRAINRYTYSGNETHSNQFLWSNAIHEMLSVWMHAVFSSVLLSNLYQVSRPICKYNVAILYAECCLGGNLKVNTTYLPGSCTKIANGPLWNSIT